MESTKIREEVSDKNNSPGTRIVRVTWKTYKVKKLIITKSFKQKNMIAP
jgi:hypothetical protein